MVNPAIIQYVRESLAQGKTKEQIQRDLINGGGWKQNDIDEVFAAVGYEQKTGKSKGFSKILMTLIILLVLGGGGYVAWGMYGATIKEQISGLIGTDTTPEVTTAQPESTLKPIETSTPTVETPPATTEPPTTTPSFAPGNPQYTAIEALAKTLNSAAGTYPLAIVSSTDITNDSIPELLVSLGSETPTSPVATHTIIRYEGTVAEIAKVRYGSKMSTFSGMIGSPTSNQKDNIELIASKNAILASSCYKEFKGKKNVAFVTAYVWNPLTKVFEHDKALSTEETTKFGPVCATIFLNN